MKYRLKKGVEAFQVVDGEFEGSLFKPGKIYTLIPTNESNKFEKVDESEKVKPKPLNIKDETSLNSNLKKETAKQEKGVSGK